MKRIIAIIVVLLAAALIYSSAYVVQEWQQVEITRFGKPIGQELAAKRAS